MNRRLPVIVQQYYKPEPERPPLSTYEQHSHVLNQLKMREHLRSMKKSFDNSTPR